MELSEAIIKAIQDFDKDVITEERFINIIADYYSFRDNPREKHVLTDIVKGGYTACLMNLSEGLDISIVANKMVNDVCKNLGFGEELVVDVVSSIMKGLSINYRYQTKHKTKSTGKTIPMNTMKPQSPSAHKRNISLYSGEDLMIILEDIFMLPLRSGRDGAVQKAMIKQLLGDDEGQFVLDYFLKKR